MLNKSLLAAASIFLIWQSYELLRSIDRMEIDTWWLLLLAAWIINMFITGIFAFAGFAFPTQKILSPKYYRIYHPERLKSVFTVLRVDLFRQFLLATFWKSKKQRSKFFDGKVNGLANLIEQSKKSEFGHLIPFVLIVVVCIYLLAKGMLELSFLTLLVNIIGNLYPIILQRHHRMRIQRINKK